ncbi:hypothetical protein C8Q76DRAFT_659740 [Earliella scabrosa]|nr:hypothetical protein C8Q76DRAFT_659740 [Earliella scabrosa]
MDAYVAIGLVLIILFLCSKRFRMVLLSLLQSFSPLARRYGVTRIPELSLNCPDTSGPWTKPDVVPSPHEPQGPDDRLCSISPASISPADPVLPTPDPEPPLEHLPRHDIPPQRPLPLQQNLPAPPKPEPDGVASPASVIGPVSSEVKTTDIPSACVDHAAQPPTLPEKPKAPQQENATSSEGSRKDDELWLEDGNLILVTPTVQFRVYRGPLVSQSLVFRDMLSLPQPPVDAASCAPQNVPCITIPMSDSPEDLRHFLRVMTGQSVCFGGLNPTYDEISALVRMGHKYQCEKLLARCTEYLKRYYHDDFDLWRNDEHVFSPPTFKPIHNIGVVNLARLLGANVMLPGALMGCCTLGMEIVDGFTREDGTKEMLSFEDLARCYLGRANLVEANADATLKLLTQTLAEGCLRPERCEPTMRKILNELTGNNRKVLFNLRWDWSWSPFIDREDTERDLCWECYKMLGKHGRQKERHRAIFDKMPTMMGVTVERWGLPPEPEAEVQDPPAPILGAPMPAAAPVVAPPPAPLPAAAAP